MTKLLRRVRHRLNLMSLSSVARAVLKDKLTYLPVEKLRRIERAAREVSAAAVVGDILEFGVALGGSGIVLAHHASPSRRYLGLDVFGTIPPPASEKDDAKSRARFEAIQSGAARGIRGDTYYGYKQDLLGEVKESFQRHGVPVDGDRVWLVRGLFEQSWPELDIGAVALAHIDCDWYDPVKYCLRAMADRMKPGAIVIIDDYHDYGGCRTAVEEFLAERSDFAFEAGRNPFLRKI